MGGWIQGILGILLGLAANECSSVSPWLARRLVRWAANIRYPSRAEELEALINDRPGKLLKLITAFGFVCTALVYRVTHRRSAHRWSFGGRVMKGLSDHGEITYEGENHDWLIALKRNAQTTIDATSFMAVNASGQVDGGELWKSDLGRYLKAQQRALDRQVTIRCIFMLDDPDGADSPELQHICKIQQDLGILVRILDPLTLPGQYWLFDFIVFDSVISFESTQAAWAKKGAKPAIVSTRLVLTPQRVAKRVAGFETLWSAARDY